MRGAAKGILMQSVKVPVRVRRDAAINEGSTAYGDTDFVPSRAQLEELVPEERAFLGAHEVTRLELAEGSVTWEGVRAAIRREREKDAARAEERERQILAALAEPDDAWLHQAWGESYWTVRPPGNLSAAFTVEDPRLAKRVDHLLKTIAKPRNAAIDREAEEAKRRREAEADRRREELAEAEERGKQAILDYAAACGGPLARAAAEGYDVRTAVVDRVIAVFLASLKMGYRILEHGSPLWRETDWEERAAPDEVAFRRLDEVRACVSVFTDADKRLIPRGWTMEIGRISRVEAEDGEKDWPRTVIPIELAGPCITTRTILITAEDVGDV